MNDRYIEICESLEWKVEETDDGYVELEKESPAGEDFVFTVKSEDFAKNVMRYFDDFDPEEHVFNLLSAKRRGFAGVPGIRELTDDAFAIQDMLDDLAIALWQAREENDNESVC